MNAPRICCEAEYKNPMDIEQDNFNICMEIYDFEEYKMSFFKNISPSPHHAVCSRNISHILNNHMCGFDSN